MELTISLAITADKMLESKKFTENVNFIKYIYVMRVVNVATGKSEEVLIEEIAASDYKLLTKARYYFIWKSEKVNTVYKLRKINSEDILGVISLQIIPKEQRIGIKLLACSIENAGKLKLHEGIAGNLIAFACREAVKNFGVLGCVSLFPKTKLKKHYINKYGMVDAGKQIFLELEPLFSLLKQYYI